MLSYRKSLGRLLADLVLLIILKASITSHKDTYKDKKKKSLQIICTVTVTTVSLGRIIGKLCM